MDYRDERDALRGRVENLEQELAEAKWELRGQRSRRHRGALRAGAVIVVAVGIGVGAVAVKRRATAGATTTAKPASAASELCAKTAECCRNYYMGRTWRDAQTRHSCEAELEHIDRHCKGIAEGPGDACQKDAACRAQMDCQFAGSPEPSCKDMLDYYRGRGRGCELVEPPPPVATARTVEPPTGPFTVGPRFPMFAPDATGATVDPLVWGRSGQQSCLARFDARAGASTWINCAYGPIATQFNRSAVIGDHVLVEFERDFDGLDVKTGAKLWTARLDQRVMDLCLGPDGTLRVVIEGGDTYVLAPETGKLTPSKRTYDCQVIWDDWRWGSWKHSAPGQSFGHDPDGLPTVDGMVPRGLVAHGDRTIVLGYEKPGPHVPMAAAVDKKGKLLWKRGLPPADQGAADTDAPSHATLDDRRLCATYSVKQGVRVGCWDPATGVTLWDSPVGVVKDARELGELVFTDSDLILLHDAHNQHASSNALGVFDLGTGGWRYDIQ